MWPQLEPYFEIVAGVIVLAVMVAVMYFLYPLF